MAAASGISYERRPDSSLLVRLTGAFRLAAHLPDIEGVRRALIDAPPRRLVYESSAIADWDGSLVARLLTLEQACAAAQVEVDRAGLPDGLRRLLELAQAVSEKEGARRSEKQASWLERVGGAATRSGAEIKTFFTFVGEAALSVGRLVRGRARFRRLDLAMLFEQCGWQALPIVTLISFLVGLILAFVGAIQLEQFGAELYVANLVGIAMVREMGAMMGAIVMAGRTGAAFAAQLGTMRVTQEIDALTTLGFSSFDFLVLPRMLALSLMMPLLTLYADFVGIAGGAFVSVTMLDIGIAQYWDQTIGAVALDDFMVGLVKSSVFGVLVAIAGCLRGTQCGNSSAAVGQAATSAVVTGIVLVILADAIFTVLFNAIGV